MPERQELEGSIKGEGTATILHDIHGEGELTPQTRDTWALKSAHGGKTPSG